MQSTASQNVGKRTGRKRTGEKAIVEERKGRVNEEGIEVQPETVRNSRTTTKVDMRHWLWR